MSVAMGSLACGVNGDGSTPPPMATAAGLLRHATRRPGASAAGFSSPRTGGRPAVSQRAVIDAVGAIVVVVLIIVLATT
jgi:hypothetical protein